MKKTLDAMWVKTWRVMSKWVESIQTLVVSSMQTKVMRRGKKESAHKNGIEMELKMRVQTGTKKMILFLKNTFVSFLLGPLR